MFRGDILFAEFEQADEIFFLTVGKFKLYTDLSERIQLPPDTINLKTEGFNVPFATLKEGCYFGDQDTMIDLNHGHSANRVWKSSAVADYNSEVLCINVEVIDQILKNFPEIRRQMIDVAMEKNLYYEILTKQSVVKFKNQVRLQKEIDFRLTAENRYITTRLSLKRQRMRKLHGVENLKDLRQLEKYQKRLIDTRMIVDQ